MIAGVAEAFSDTLQVGGGAVYHKKNGSYSRCSRMTRKHPSRYISLWSVVLWYVGSILESGLGHQQQQDVYSKHAVAGVCLLRG